MTEYPVSNSQNTITGSATRACNFNPLEQTSLSPGSLLSQPGLLGKLKPSLKTQGRLTSGWQPRTDTHAHAHTHTHQHTNDDDQLLSSVLPFSNPASPSRFYSPSQLRPVVPQRLRTLPAAGVQCPGPEPARLGEMEQAGAGVRGLGAAHTLEREERIAHNNELCPLGHLHLEL